MRHRQLIMDSFARYKSQMEGWLIRSCAETEKMNAHTSQIHRQDEMSLYAHTESREHKHVMQWVRNRKIMEMQFNEAEAGGSNNVKLEEPIAPSVENPHLQEMRLMHVDFTEEAYWKRCVAMKLAHECRNVVQQKAKAAFEKKKAEQPQVKIIVPPFPVPDQQPETLLVEEESPKPKPEEEVEAPVSKMKGLFDLMGDGDDEDDQDESDYDDRDSFGSDRDEPSRGVISEHLS
jgi:hypothetical protein